MKALEDKPDGPYVTMLARQEGRKESRYSHLFSGEPDESVMPSTRFQRAASGDSSRIEALELQVNELKLALQELEQRLETFMKQFE